MKTRKTLKFCREQTTMDTTSTWTIAIRSTTSLASWQLHRLLRQLNRLTITWTATCTTTISCLIQTLVLRATPTTQLWTVPQLPLRNLSIKSRTSTFSMTFRSFSSSCKTWRNRRCARFASIAARTWFSFVAMECVSIAATRSTVAQYAEKQSRSAFYCSRF